MKIVINKCFGGFEVSKEALKELGVDYWGEDEDARMDSRLVALVEKDPEKASGWCAKLAVVEIPDEATDYHLDEYDGFEDIIYVLDGKLHWV